MRARRGLSLPELIVCCFIFITLIIALMATFIQAARTFQLLVTRQGIQTELRRINALLRRDVALTDFRSLGVVEGDSATTSDERDAVCFVGVDSWTDRANFDDYLKPLWNIYVLYYGTRNQNDKVPPSGDPSLGQLIRKEVVQSIPFPVPLEKGFLGNAIATPGTSYKLLTRNLVSFKAELNQMEENLRVHLVLRSDRNATTLGRQRESELIECYIDMRPENTWPPR